jgi:hypothetical protein
MSRSNQFASLVTWERTTMGGTQMDLSSGLAPRAARRRRRTTSPETRLLQQERRRARNCHELTELLNERTELQGVSPTADFVAEAVRWSA